MFRITLQKRAGVTCATIDGRLDASDIGEMRRVLSSVEGSVELCLGGLDACSDEVGEELRAWMERGARIKSATPYLKMLLAVKPDAVQPVELKETSGERV